MKRFLTALMVIASAALHAATPNVQVSLPALDASALLNATVTLVPMQTASPTAALFLTLPTDASGVVTFTNVPAGRYQMHMANSGIRDLKIIVPGTSGTVLAENIIDPTENWTAPAGVRGYISSRGVRVLMPPTNGLAGQVLSDIDGLGGLGWKTASGGGDTIWTNAGGTVNPIAIFADQGASGAPSLLFGVYDTLSATYYSTMQFNAILDKDSPTAEMILTAAPTNSVLSSLHLNASAFSEEIYMSGQTLPVLFDIWPSSGATQTAYTYDTSRSHTSGNLFLLKNFGTEVFKVQVDGTALSKTGGASNLVLAGTYYFSTAAYTNLNAAGTISNLANVTIAGNTLTNTGDAFRAEWEGTMPAATPNTNQFQIVFGSQTLLDTGLLPASNTTFSAWCKVRRLTGSNAQRAFAHLEWGPGGGAPHAFTNATLDIAQTNGIDTILALKGGARIVGAHTNNSFSVEVFRASQ